MHLGDKDKNIMNPKHQDLQMHLLLEKTYHQYIGGSSLGPVVNILAIFSNANVLNK